MRWKGVRFQIRDGWYDAGKRMTALGPPVFVEQEWLPVKLDDEDDPTFFKLAGLTRRREGEGATSELRGRDDVLGLRRIEPEAHHP